MTTPTTTRRAPATAEPSRDDKRHGRRLAVLTVCLALLTVTAVVSWTRLQAEPPRPTNSVYGPGSPLVAGGSVYREQVPQSTRFGDGSQLGNPLTVGGSVYTEQVPQPVRATDPYRPGNPLASGGSVYTEQVPPPARATDPHRPGNPLASAGSVYDEQVPQAAP
jgi:hypothetical protein